MMDIEECPKLPYFGESLDLNKLLPEEVNMDVNKIESNHLKCDLKEFIKDNFFKSEWTEQDDQGVNDFIPQAKKIFANWISDFYDKKDWEESEWQGIQINGNEFDLNFYVDFQKGQPQMFHATLYACKKIKSDKDNPTWQTLGNTFITLFYFEGDMVLERENSMLMRIRTEKKAQKINQEFESDFFGNLDQVLADFFGVDWSYKWTAEEGGYSIKIETWGLEEEEE